MNYAMNLLKQSIYELQKSRDSLCSMADTIKKLKNSDNEDIRKEVLKDFESDKHSLDDKIDSLYYAIDYLGKSSIPLNCRSDIEDSVWVKIGVLNDIRYTDEFVEELTPIVGKGNVMKCECCGQFIIFVKGKTVNEFHNKIFEVAALFEPQGGDS